MDFDFDLYPPLLPSCCCQAAAAFAAFSESPSKGGCVPGLALAMNLFIHLEQLETVRSKNKHF